MEEISCYQCQRILGKQTGSRWIFKCPGCGAESQPGPGAQAQKATPTVRALEEQLASLYKKYTDEKLPYTCSAKPRYGPTVHYDPKGPGPDGATWLSVGVFTALGVLALFQSPLFGLVMIGLAGYVAWSGIREGKTRWDGFKPLQDLYRLERQRLLDQLAKTLGRTERFRVLELEEPAGVVPPIISKNQLAVILTVCAGIVAAVFAIAYVATHF